MNVAEYQNNIIKQILAITDIKKLDEIGRLLKKIAPLSKHLVEQEEEKDIMEFETFEEWDAYLQSIEYHDPDEFLREWGMTSIEFRKFIWDSEHSGTIPVEEFYDKMSKLRS